MEECIFCKIKFNELPSTKLYEDDNFFIIKDINPLAKIHLIAIPKEHYSSLDMQTEKGAELFGKIINKIANLQEELGLTNTTFSPLPPIPSLAASSAVNTILPQAAPGEAARPFPITVALSISSRLKVS